jgi:hypothetical protein
LQSNDQKPSISCLSGAVMSDCSREHLKHQPGCGQPQ